MNSSKISEEWLLACNLCGSLDFEKFRETDVPLYTCRVCGLAQRVEEESETSLSAFLDPALFEPLLTRIARMRTDRSELTILVLGPLRPLLKEHLSTKGLSIMEYRDSLRSAAFTPESFDMIVCTRSVETFVSPADLYAKARLWLKSEGSFFVGGANWEAVERRLSSRRWIREHGSGKYYLGFSHMKSYATRYGFELNARGTTPRIPAIARICFGSDSFTAQCLAFPVGLVGLFPTLGTNWWGLLTKRGLATQSVVEKESEALEGATGLAAATRTMILRKEKNLKMF